MIEHGGRIGGQAGVNSAPRFGLRWNPSGWCACSAASCRRQVLPDTTASRRRTPQEKRVPHPFEAKLREPRNRGHQGKGEALLTSDSSTPRNTSRDHCSAAPSTGPLEDSRGSSGSEHTMRWWMPPEELPLFNTSWWTGATEQQRRDYARQEAVKCAAWIIELEYALLAILTRVIRHAAARHQVPAFAAEASDEWRHIRMFTQVIEATGADAVDTGPIVRTASWIFRRPVFGDTAPFILTFMMESYILAVHDACLSSPARLEPAARQAHMRHANDEVRHLRLAREEIVQRWPRLKPIARAAVRTSLLLVGATVVHTAFSTPESRSTSARSLRREVRSSQHYRRLQRARFRHALAFLSEIGVSGAISRRVWRALRLVDP